MQEIKLKKISSYLKEDLEGQEERAFKQLNLYKEFKLCCECVQEKHIEGTMAEIQGVGAKIISTIEDTSLEGQHLTGEKLVVLGEVQIKTFYVNPHHNKNRCCLEETIPFSTYIVIPKDACEKDVVTVEYIMEDITTLIIAPGQLFVSITFLLHYVEDV